MEMEKTQLHAAIRQRAHAEKKEPLLFADTGAQRQLFSPQLLSHHVSKTETKEQIQSELRFQSSRNLLQNWLLLYVGVILGS